MSNIKHVMKEYPAKPGQLAFHRIMWPSGRIVADVFTGQCDADRVLAALNNESADKTPLQEKKP